jgi:hypothetical protein
MADLWVDVDTAVIVPVNILPLLDDTDFKSIETAVVYNSAGLALTWNFQTCAGVVTGVAVTPTTAGDYDWSEPIADKGMYAIEIPASAGVSINNDTEGVGWFTGVATGVLPWRGPTIGFRRAALNDLLIEGGTASTNMEDFFDGTGYAGGTAKLGVNLVSILGTALTETGGQIAAAFKKFFDKGTPTGTVNSLPDAVAGAAGGVAIVGSQMVVPNTQKVDVETIKTQAVTCAAGVTVLASVGTAATSTAQTGDSFPLVSTEVAEIYAAVITNATGTDIAADIIALKTVADTIQADTDLLDDAVGGIADIHTDVAAVKAETAELKAAVITNATGVDIAADIIAMKIDTAAILVDTGTTLDVRIPAALIGGRMDANASAIAGVAAAATNLAASAGVIYIGSVTGAAATTTLIDSALTQAADDFWIGRIVIFTSGTLKYQATDITAFDAATDKLTFTALTGIPGAADTYVIV